MLLKFFYLIFIGNGLWCVAMKVKSDKTIKFGEIIRAQKSPYFELACKRLGGTCASIDACPPGTKVGDYGLCPVQQEYDLQCCRPIKNNLNCREINGKCISKNTHCAKRLRVRDVSDCFHEEKCCLNPIPNDD